MWTDRVWHVHVLAALDCLVRHLGMGIHYRQVQGPACLHLGPRQRAWQTQQLGNDADQHRSHQQQIWGLHLSRAAGHCTNV